MFGIGSIRNVTENGIRQTSLIDSHCSHDECHTIDSDTPAQCSYWEFFSIFRFEYTICERPQKNKTKRLISTIFNKAHFRYCRAFYDWHTIWQSAYHLQPRKKKSINLEKKARALYIFQLKWPFEIVSQNQTPGISTKSRDAHLQRPIDYSKASFGLAGVRNVDLTFQNVNNKAFNLNKNLNNNRCWKKLTRATEKNCSCNTNRWI